MNPTHIRIYINKLLSKLDQSKQERCEYMEGYRDGLAFAITAIREKELQIASTKAEPKPPSYKLDQFPNGLLGTKWRYSDHSKPGVVTLHEDDAIELDYESSTDCITVEWLFKAYTLVSPEDECEREPSAPGSREASDLGDGC